MPVSALFVNNEAKMKLFSMFQKCCLTYDFCVFLWGVELITATYGKVYNGITDDETRVHNMYPMLVLAHVNKPVLSPHASFRVLPGASCFLVHASSLLVGLVIRTAVLTASRLCQS